MNKRIGDLLLMLSLLSLLGCSGERPADIGASADRLRACPDSPNCVSSFDERDSHYIEPIDGTLDDVRSAIAAMDRAAIIEESGNYLYAEFTSRLMRFVDDVEFLADPAQNVVYVRSASRIGRSDLGVNRDRVETIRQAVSE